MQVPVNTSFNTLIFELTNFDGLTNVKEYDEIAIGNGEFINLGDIVLESEYYDSFEGEIVDCFGDALSQSAIINPCTFSDS